MMSHLNKEETWNLLLRDVIEQVELLVLALEILVESVGGHVVVLCPSLSSKLG